MYTCSVVQCQKILRKVLVIRLLFLLQEWRSMMQSMVVRQVVEKFGLIQAVLAHGELERGGAGRIPPVSGRTCSKRCHERSTLMKFQVEKKLFFKRPPWNCVFYIFGWGFCNICIFLNFCACLYLKKTVEKGSATMMATNRSAGVALGGESE